MLESAILCSVKNFIQMSSYEAYGATKLGPKNHREDETLAPINPYDAGKAAAEMLIMSSKHRSTLDMIVIHANNIYSPNQYPDNESIEPNPSRDLSFIKCSKNSFPAPTK